MYIQICKHVRTVAVVIKLSKAVHSQAIRQHNLKAEDDDTFTIKAFKGRRIKLVFALCIKSRILRKIAKNFQARRSTKELNSGKLFSAQQASLESKTKNSMPSP
ncbi:hypothetical protein GQX74_000129 [Glossina fuscipes]|nr:hypothetical protein GQX74_000129 [Glossina fuscipes]